MLYQDSISIWQQDYYCIRIYELQFSVKMQSDFLFLLSWFIFLVVYRDCFEIRHYLPITQSDTEYFFSFHSCNIVFFVDSCLTLYLIDFMARYKQFITLCFFISDLFIGKVDISESSTLSLKCLLCFFIVITYFLVRLEQNFVVH